MKINNYMHKKGKYFKQLKQGRTNVYCKNEGCTNILTYAELFYSLREFCLKCEQKNKLCK